MVTSGWCLNLDMDLKNQSVTFFEKVLNSVNPKLFIPNAVHWSDSGGELSIQNQLIKIPDGAGLYIIGFGKASPTMAEAVENILGDRLHSGYIIAPPGSSAHLNKTDMAIGSHPIPDERSIKATHGLFNFINQIPDGSVLINLVSGGTSALLCSPAEPLSLNDLQIAFKLLIESGATIQEINTVRKTLSSVKGGQLLEFLHKHTLLDLMISDIPDDDLKHIGSGPTTPQMISYIEAMSISETYDIFEKFPKSVQNHLRNKVSAVQSIETGVHANRKPVQHYSWIISSAIKAAHKAKSVLENEGFNTSVISPAWSGDINKFQEHIINHVKSNIAMNVSGKMAFIFFGECTVEIRGNGLGGRNQELALRISRELRNFNHNISFLSAGTDGIDGPTDVAGAVVDQNSYENALRKNIDPEEYLRNNDSYHFFQKTDGHIKTGPTGNNVMDLQIILSDPGT